MQKVLGIDIGISNVGWGIINQQTGEIIEAGVRIFEEATRNANEERRGFRSSRRLKRRKSHRLERACQLFNQYDLPLSGIGKVNPYEVRYRGIYGKVNKDELVAALYHIVKKRGTILDSTEEGKSGDDFSTIEQLNINKKLLETKYVCEIQLERLANKDEKLRNHENQFRTVDYVNEARAILNNQKQIHSEITEDFISKVIQLIEERRQYYDGPGSEKSPTPYGCYYLDKKGSLVITTMINKMRGKCTYFHNEMRMAKMSFTADLFNLLSGDLNKLQINGEYLSYEDKSYLVNQLIKKGKSITLTQILKYKAASEDADVTGYRVDLKTDKPIFTEFKGYKLIRKVVIENELPVEILDNIEMVDSIIEILTSEKSYQRRDNQLLQLFCMYNNNEARRIVDAFKESTGFTGYHSLSKKAIDSIIEELWHTNKNQMQIFSERGIEGKRLIKYNNYKNIAFDDDAILSTVAKRAHREAIKIINEIRKKHGELAAIAIETAREKNSEEKRRQYADYQKKIGKHEKEMAKLLGVSSLAELRLSSKQLLALKLWESQDYKCIYSGKSIDIHDIIINPSLFEIDHIIPISLSFDDSQANKVICYHGENQRKGQKTPYQYFASGKAPRTFDQFKIEVLNLYKSNRITSKKKDYLLELRNIEFNEELQKEFINRNLIDTQYAMRSLSMTLRTFFKVNNIDTKILSIRGSFTAALRRRAKLYKDREENYAHHAIDALIVAAIGKMPVLGFFKYFDMNEEGIIFDKDKGIFIDEDEFFSHSYIAFLRRLMSYEPKIKYSHKVDRKINRSLSNQTIYSTREKDGETRLIRRTSNIYHLNKNDNELKTILKLIDKEPENLLIVQYNPELLELFKKIVNEYSTSDNPFRAYFEEHGYILKDGKVPVKKLKYYGDRLGVHLDITHKYPNSKYFVVMLSINKLRVDVFKNQEGNYKCLGVPYCWFKQKGDQFILNMDEYNKQKSVKKITDTDEFLFSLYKNDRFSYVKNGEYYERIFIGDSSPTQHKIEVDFVNRRRLQEERGSMFLYISKLSNIVKYNMDILGNTYKIEKENFKNYLQI